MNEYYFLVASLPLLAYDAKAPLSSAEFLDVIRIHLHSDDFTAVSAASIDAPLTVDGLTVSDRRWREHERGLRNTLARTRASKRNTDLDTYVRTDDLLHDETERVGMEDVARDAITAVSPLSGEDLINRTRWSELDNLEAGHNFDVEFLVAYYLKLQLLERRGMFTRDDGEAAFLSITESIMNDYYQEQGEA